VVFEGGAGAFPIRVVIRPPAVVPGRAQVLVRVLAGTPSAVTVQPIWALAASDEGAPPPEAALPVREERGLFLGWLWLMRPGSYSVRVAVAGPGGGEALVPVAALATRRLEMARGLGSLLAGLMALLAAGAVAVVGAAAREASLAPGLAPDRDRRRRGAIAMGVAAVVLAAGLVGGWRWWGRVDANFRRDLYRPFPITARVRPAPGGRLLELAIAGEGAERRQWTPLEPDHGKLMHLFLVREPALDAFAHVHPVATSQRHDAFVATLPALPPGRYRFYADVTHRDGLAQTLTDEVTVPEASGGTGVSGLLPDPDDTAGECAPLPGPTSSGAAEADLGDGFRMERVGGPLRAGAEADLAFAVHGPPGHDPVLEPYMGMQGHALVRRDDGTVFIHLHPFGTVSMAAQEVFARRLSPAAAPHQHAAAAVPVVTFPYEFPRPGRYRAWVQVRVEGRIRTGVFDLVVS
jgi:hypothetical protein